jgi:CRISPR-associated protein Cmr3
MADLISIQPAADEGAPETLTILRPRRALAEIARGGDGLELLWIGEPGVRSRPCEQAFLRPDPFLNYLVGDMGTQTRSALVSLKTLFREEPRTGVQLEGRNAQQGRLYTERVVFPNLARQVRFHLFFETRAALPEAVLTDHLVRLGGEGKLARLSLAKAENDLHPALPERAREDVRQTVWDNSSGEPPFRVKLCLLAPAVYSARKELLWRLGTRTPAWRPYWMNNASGGWCRPIFDNQRYRLRLVAAAAPKAFALGAWDRAQQNPRPLHRCQPAGAVYYFELAPEEGVSPEDALNDFFEDFWLGTLLVKAKPAAPPRTRDGQTVVRTRDTVTPHGLRGFGWTTIGAWNYA